MTTANITPKAMTDGIPYGTAVPLTTTEASLGDGLKTPDPISVEEGQAIVAVVSLTINGSIVGSNAYVVMPGQSHLGIQKNHYSWWPRSTCTR